MVKTFTPLVVISMLLLCSCPAVLHAADVQAASADSSVRPEEVRLNADRVSFNDETGQAYAEGSAVLTYQDMTIQAERIEYDSATQKVHAMPLPGDQVILRSGERAIRGDQLDYDLNTREGLFTGAATRLPLGDGHVLYVYGSEIDVLPWELARERGLVKGEAEDYLIQWRDVVFTTCALDHPHYRLESKTISFIPGKLIRAKKPRIYIKNTYLFTSPIDYVMQLRRNAVQYSFLPYFQRSEIKGSNGGITATLGWETGSATFGVSYSRKSNFEFMAEILQQLNDDFSIRVGIERSWDDVWDEKIWRPYASILYDKNGWAVRLNWSRNEYISDRKDSLYQFKGRLNREPEFIMWAPWHKDSAHTWSRIYATYGRYSETVYGTPESDTVSRYGMGFRHYFESPWGKAEVFANSDGSAMFYNTDNADHEMLRSFLGVRYKIGVLELGTGYERQFVWGESPMLWDNYRDRERVHQKIRLPLGREIYAGVRGSYDLRENIIDEVTYSLQWDTDCMLWDLHYTNDRTRTNDDSIGLTLSFKAFPNRKASFGQRVKVDPFDRPEDVPKN